MDGEENPITTEQQPQVDPTSDAGHDEAEQDHIEGENEEENSRNATVVDDNANEEGAVARIDYAQD
jgi:hypothetical protein